MSVAVHAQLWLSHHVSAVWACNCIEYAGFMWNVRRYSHAMQECACTLVQYCRKFTWVSVRIIISQHTYTAVLVKCVHCWQLHSTCYIKFVSTHVPKIVSTCFMVGLLFASLASVFNVFSPIILRHFRRCRCRGSSGRGAHCLVMVTWHCRVGIAVVVGCSVGCEWLSMAVGGRWR